MCLHASQLTLHHPLSGTRLSVEFILELFASGASHADILRKYPNVTSEGLNAALRYAARALKNEVVWDIEASVAA